MSFPPGASTRRYAHRVESPPFSRLASVYDAIMADVEYDEWIDFVLREATRRGFAGGRVLDLACGTGNATLPFDVRGFDVEGVDASSAMLARARAKLPGVRFVEGDLRTFDTGRRYALVVSVFDSLNNLLTHDDFLTMLGRVRHHLVPGGQFVFDCNTRAGLIDLWEGGRAEGWADDVFYRWEHSYDPATDLARVEAFCDAPDGSFTEEHFERPYDPAELRELLATAGFSDVEVVRFPEADEAREDEPRVWAFATR